MTINKPAFILSTGRTGTQFFEDYINSTSENALCLHEPKPSRRFKFLSNMYLQGKVSANLVCYIFKKSRLKIGKKADKKIYVESSNFIFGCIPALNNCLEDVKVLHIIRNPFTYVVSHLNKGFWRGHKKFVAKYGWFWVEDLNLDKKSKRDPIKVLLERWVYVNRQIESYEKTNKYLAVRFEDLFSKDKSISLPTLNKIREFLELPPLHEGENEKWLTARKNISKRNDDRHQLSETHKAEFIEKHTDMLKKYGY